MHQAHVIVPERFAADTAVVLAAAQLAILSPLGQEHKVQIRHHA